jgi:TldD protein
MRRRDFIKVTAKGGILTLATPPILEYLLRHEALPQGLPTLGETGFEDTMLRVMETALSEGGRFADVYLEETLKTGITLVDGMVQSAEYGVHKGGGVRVISDWRTGYAFCDSWEESELAKVAGVASGVSRGGGKVKIASLSERCGKGVVQYEMAPDGVEAGRKVEVVRLADSVARKYDPAITQVKVNYRDEIKRILVCNSDGVIAREEIPLVWIEVNTLAERGSRRSPGYVRASKKLGFEYTRAAFVEEIATEAARQAVDMLYADEAPSGEIPVVIGSGGGVVFHEAVGHGLEADGIEKQTSFYTGLVGTRVGSRHITVVDDGTLANLRGSFDFDDEGTPSGRTVLIEDGILKGYIYDLLTSWKLKAVPTGNGRRESYMHYPLVRMTNTFITPGNLSPDEIIAATPNGIFTKHLGGGEVDTATGNFTFGVREAYRIENGRITSPVRGATLIGNGPEILKRIDMVGDDVSFWPGTCGKGQWVPITSGAPTLRISSIVVGGRG